MRRVIVLLCCALLAPAIPARATDCTRVLGYSVTRQWSEDAGVFETIVPDDQWETAPHGGGNIVQWGRPDSKVWRTPVDSSCGTPTAVLLQVVPGRIIPQRRLERLIDIALATIHEKLPTVGTIRLLPPNAGPDGGACYYDGVQVYTTQVQQLVVDAIAATDGIVAEPAFNVADCAWFADTRGHVTPDGAVGLATLAGAQFA